MDSEVSSPDQMKQTQQRRQESEGTIAEATAADVRNTVEVDAVDGVAEVEASDGGDRGDNGAFVSGATAREDDGSRKEKEDNRGGGGDDDGNNGGGRCHPDECGDGRPNRNIGLGGDPPDRDDGVDGGNLVRAPGAAADGGEDGETARDRADVGSCTRQSESSTRNGDGEDGAAGDSGIVAEFAHGSRPLLEVVEPASAGVSTVYVRDRGLAEQGGDGGGQPRGGQGAANPTSDRVGVATPQKVRHARYYWLGTTESPEVADDEVLLV